MNKRSYVNANNILFNKKWSISPSFIMLQRKKLLSEIL